MLYDYKIHVRQNTNLNIYGMNFFNFDFELARLSTLLFEIPSKFNAHFSA